jgi:hypothetical protein
VVAARARAADVRGWLGIGTGIGGESSAIGDGVCVVVFAVYAVLLEAMEVATVASLLRDAVEEAKLLRVTGDNVVLTLGTAVEVLNAAVAGKSRKIELALFAILIRKAWK